MTFGISLITMLWFHLNGVVQSTSKRKSTNNKQRVKIFTSIVFYLEEVRKASTFFIHRGLHNEDVSNPERYGTSLNVYKWSTQELIQVIDLGSEGCAPLEIRFLHDPKSSVGFVGCAVEANVYR